MDGLRAVVGGVMIEVHAQPGARRNEIVGRHGDAIKVRIGAPAVDDRANEALVKFLAEVFELRPRDVTLRSGFSSRHKRLLLDGIDLDTATSTLLAHLPNRPPG